MSYKTLNTAYFHKRNLNDELRLASFNSEKKLVMKYISSGNILDVGCSTGEMIEFYAWNGNAYGMEIVEYAIQEAKKRNISFDKDLTNTNNFFDVIIFRGTIQHVNTPFLYIKNALKALKPGGFLLQEKRFPYLKSPYANPIGDHFKFLLKLLGFKVKFPFWKNSMELVFSKTK
jgi:2-polyprenyl-3-methyl-5-hydroxy-6-metoxy-1,4-benzoquinol methylase